MCKNSGTFSSFLCFQVLDECLTRIHALKVRIWPSITRAICDSQVAGEDPQRIGIMVASHNEDTVRFKFQYFRDEILIKRLFWVLRTLSWFRLVASSKPPRGLCVIEITIFLTLFFPGSLWSWPYGRAWAWPPGKIYCFAYNLDKIRNWNNRFCPLPISLNFRSACSASPSCSVCATKSPSLWGRAATVCTNTFPTGQSTKSSRICLEGVIAVILCHY